MNILNKYPNEQHNNFPFPEVIMFLNGLLLSLYIFFKIFASGYPGWKSVLFCIMAICGFYALKCRKAFAIFDPGKWGISLLFALVVSLHCCFVIGVFMHGITEFFSGDIHVDTCFYAAICEAIVKFDTPSLLLTNNQFFTYHNGVCYAVAVFAKILNVPALMVINCIYPVLVSPCLTCLFLKVLAQAKKMKIGDESLDWSDVFCILFFGMGILIGALYYFLTGSPLICFYDASMSMMFSLLVLFAILYCHLRSLDLKFCFWFIPVAVFALMMCKSSTAAFYICGISIYLFTRGQYSKWCLKEILCIVLSFAMFVFGSLWVMSPSSYSLKFVPFAFLKVYCRFPFFIMSLILFPVIFYLVKTKWSVKKLFSGEQVIGNILLGTTIAMNIPGLIWDIPGASASYFILLPYMLAIFVFCADSTLPGFIRKIAGKRWFRIASALGVGIFLAAATVLYVHSGAVKNYAAEIQRKINKKISLKNQKRPYSVTQSAIFRNLNDVRKFVSKNASSVLAYVDDKFPFAAKDSRATAFLIPAYIGAPVVNSFYYESGKFFSFRKTENGRIEPQEFYRHTNGMVAYGFDDKPFPKMSLNDVLAYAAKEKVRYLIVFSEKTEIIDLTCMKKVYSELNKKGDLKTVDKPQSYIE